MLRLALAECTKRNFTVGELDIDQHDEAGAVTVWLNVQGAGSANDLTAALADIDGVLSVLSDDADSFAFSETAEYSCGLVGLLILLVRDDAVGAGAF